MANHDVACIYYVYIILDLFGVPRYVGKGKNNRAFAHEARSGNKRVSELYEEARTLGQKPPLSISALRFSEAEAFAYEKAIIGSIGRENLGTGPLYNLTDGGGAGTTGQKWTPSQREKLVKAQTGKRHKPETILKISSSQKLRVRSPGSTMAATQARAGSRHTLEARTKIGAANRRAWEESIGQFALCLDD